ncbi:MAG: tRNA guanosine(34) transglycosylase Tgt [Chthonomonadetes bacterium]|nr:tRNA guanosine(34) transglycosylase Tgt [Chthonomonadetes bacterium]
MRPAPDLRFEITARDSRSRARCGVLYLPHGEVETPVFMPVGTQGTVKAMTQEELERLDLRIILCNTYHLYLRPGHERVAKAGGLHRFIAWHRNILTDSGGFQVFSLQGLRRVYEDGVEFQSHIDGSYHYFTPERAIEVQHALGADIIMAFDECPPYPCSWEQAQQAMERTHRWAVRCLEAHDTAQALFGIVQGSVYEDLREQSARFISELGFPGIAIGGVAVGEEKPEIHRIVAFTTPLLPEEKPRYLMGVGELDDILQAVASGVDMFDCVVPTRMARNAAMITRRGRVNLRNARFADDFGPVDPECDCPVCQRYSAAYIRHLFNAREILAARLATYHNLYFYQKFMRDIRQAIREGNLEQFTREFLQEYMPEESRPSREE